MDPRPLPPGWISQYDANSARYYFVNTATGQSTWTDPRGPPLPPPPPPGYGYPAYQQPAVVVQAPPQPQVVYQSAPPVVVQQPPVVVHQGYGYHHGGYGGYGYGAGAGLAGGLLGAYALGKILGGPKFGYGWGWK
ncbi:hypothetical protein M427DRAFT_60785 [Gonapodya prolifera JEL478]|uniref:WW domain-containing protein n=1 Tax=Gonapodya prolifera (strain JEL478) TaxID=1344416 RepID=A0A139A3K1_GONPJ|nr:hypothetical protein M427DRAFT_60785 [Gonapodya prolifera JEL478]|eukprot:KXS11372.1 hypothetical protein M427DRAFT_60785 [Gonapodya prolifera JEL478]